ncbi:Holliday junction resolvase RuvX [Roseibium litorale]|uniref:Putative pre-16S rRNA nuclease n=1 Tax=Roseibium litorale TaxID=2803841 RepID=A0ABR9CH91_9HYPH|nr:Holliday junction resolvase RuvX [Roseibium litorale]MBD8890079.1 Holliday junction resolvase RuvX [Roseibium litorale]
MASDPTLTLDAFLEVLRPNSRLIGLDLGTKTIGLALSDLGRGIASPMETIRRKKFTLDAQELLKICAKQEVGGLVLGLPLNMDGSEGPRVQATRAFARNLAPMTDLPITLWDERLSTAAVTRTLLEADASRARRGEVVDKMAAAFILQGFLDRLGHLQQDQPAARRSFTIYED